MKQSVHILKSLKDGMVLAGCGATGPVGGLEPKPDHIRYAVAHSWVTCSECKEISRHNPITVHHQLDIPHTEDCECLTLFPEVDVEAMIEGRT